MRHIQLRILLIILGAVSLFLSGIGQHFLFVWLLLAISVALWKILQNKTADMPPADVLNGFYRRKISENMAVIRKGASTYLSFSILSSLIVLMLIGIDNLSPISRTDHSIFIYSCMANSVAIALCAYSALYNAFNIFGVRKLHRQVMDRICTENGEKTPQTAMQ